MTPTSGTPGIRRSPDQTMTVVVGAMAGSLVLLGVVLSLVGAELVMPPLWMLLVVTGVTAGAWVVAVGPLPRPAGASAAGTTQALVMLRAAVLEAPAILGMVLAFVTRPTNLTVYVLPALCALAGLWLFARPSAVRARLARDHHALDARHPR